MKSICSAMAILVVFASGLHAQEKAHAVLGVWGVELSGMDRSARPGDNFFRYVNGAWYDRAVIPPDRTRTGGFDDLSILSEKRELEIMGELEAKPYDRLNSEEKQLRDLYDAFMNTDAIEKNGLAPAQKALESFASIQTLDDVARAMANRSIDADRLFSATVTPDAKNSNVYVMTLGQSGLGLPNRDYYLRNEKEIVATRDAYRTYLANMLGMIGGENAAARAAAVLSLETEIAKLHWTAAEQRIADKIYNPMTVPALADYAPGFPWASFLAVSDFQTTGPKGVRIVIVRENTAFPGLAKLFAATPVAVWRDWLTLHYLHRISAYLPRRFDAADFEFYGKVLNGQAQQLDRNKRAVQLLDSRLSGELGKIYVAKYFPAQSKAKVEQLVANLLKAYDADIRSIPWMTGQTRQKALDKLHAFTPHIGYPDKWRDYSDLSIRRDDLIGDVSRSEAFEWHYRIDRIDAPVDRDEWSLTAPTVNANYRGTSNSIFFPAAILQPPFFDPNADDAVNYGAIGVVIGHEISHGFDDQGSKRDGAGNLISWWTDADRKAFEERTSMLGGQYDQYEALPGLHVNGKLTMGENIGDLSGAAIAFRAYHLSLGSKTAPLIDGFTGDQRFFLAYAQVWREKVQESRMRRQILSDPHSPPQFRVLGIVRNIDAWFDAFGVKPGDKYYLPPSDRVKLW
jgi:putative endopeptidase